MKRRSGCSWSHGGLVVSLLLLPSMVFANAGTPLMWAGALYLFGGNVVLGVVEGAVNARIWRLNVKRCVGWMIVANLLSAWVGQVLLTSAIVHGLWDVDLYSLRWVLVASLVLAWVLTLLIEWPFVTLCFRGAGGWLRKSVVATVVIQTVSCVLLGGFFLMASFYSLLTEHRIVASEELNWPAGVMVYYIDVDGQSIRAFDTDTGESSVVHVMKERQRPYRSSMYLDTELVSDGANTRRLFVGQRIRYGDEQASWEDTGVEIDMDYMARFDGKPLTTENRSPQRFPFNIDWDVGVYPIGIAPADPELQSLQQGFWGAQGLSYRHAGVDGGSVKNLAIETPIATWAVRYTAALGSGLAMFQFGEDQICLLDMRTQRVALKLRGFGPIAVPKDAIVVDRVDDVDAVESGQGGS